MDLEPNDPPPRKLQFSLRTAFIVTTLFAVFCAMTVHPERLDMVMKIILASTALSIVGGCGLMFFSVINTSGTVAWRSLVALVAWISMTFLFAGFGLIFLTLVILLIELFTGFAILK